MWKVNRSVFAACAFLILAAAACSRKTSPTSARLEGNTYSNEFFGFRIEIPRGWTILNRESFERAKETGVALVMGGDKQAQAVVEASERNSHQLLMASENPMGAPVELNRSIILVAESLRGVPGVQSGKDYHYHALKLITGPGKPLKQVGEPFRVRLGLKEFYRVEVEGDVLGRKIRQAYIATVEKGYALVLVVTAQSEADVNDVLANCRLPQTQL